MPKFSYKAITESGEVVEGELEAPEKRAVITILHNRGYIPISADNSGNRDLKAGKLSVNLFKPKQITQKDIRILTQELATLLNAGLSLDHSLSIIGKISGKAAFSELIRSLQDKIQSGSSFTASLKEHPNTFGSLYISMIQAGESSGSLEVICTRLADYLERSEELKSTIISAMVYPAILLFISLISIFCMLFFVIPQFIPLFEDSGTPLPLTTEIIFGTTDFLINYWWLLLIVVTISIWIIDIQLRNEQNRSRLDYYILLLPLIGDLVKKLEITRFSRTMATLLANGVPLLTSAQIIQGVIKNRAIASVIDSAITDVEQGNGLTRTLEESGLFTDLFTELIQVGEETGQLEDMLFKLSDIYDTESRSTIKRLLTLVEPILIMSLGALIALIIISILTAVLGLNELVI